MKNPCKNYFLWLVLSAVLLSGCAGAEDTQNTAGTVSEKESVSAREETAQSAPETSPAPSEESESSAQIAFACQDIEGNAVSADVFSESRLTMVNVWATYCGPCLNEMPDLGELAGEYDPAEFQLLGIVSDVLDSADEETLTAAKELIAKTGADYPHLLLNESLYYALLTDVSVVPTTFFVNQEGEIIDTVIGSRDKSAWEETIHALLEEL